MSGDGFTDKKFLLKGKKVFVAGHAGMVGSAVCRRLSLEDCEIVTASRANLDLRRQAEVEAFMKREKPDAVVIAAAKVGGIHANASHPVAFLYDNLVIEANLIKASRDTGVKKLLFLGSSCIYPKDAPQPISEDSLLSGSLEPTNQWYALAKIAGIKLCQAYRQEEDCDFISAMPCNLYGIGDTFNEMSSHVIPALMMKADRAAKTGEALTVWGSGKPRREFLYVEDLADALVFLLENYSGEKPVNIGYGSDVTISELVAKICDAVGYCGKIAFDAGKPDGVMSKLMDSKRIFAQGWRPKVDLDTGLRRTYEWYRDKRQETKT